MPRPEETIEKKFVKKAKELGVICYKFEVVGTKGAPDQMCLIPGGGIVFFEFKRPGGGKVSHHQEEFIKSLQKIGQQAFVVDSWEEPLNIIRNYNEKN